MKFSGGRDLFRRERAKIGEWRAKIRQRGSKISLGGSKITSSCFKIWRSDSISTGGHKKGGSQLRDPPYLLSLFIYTR